MIIFLITIILIVIAVILFREVFIFIKNDRLFKYLKQLKSHRNSFLVAINEFKALGVWYICDSQYQQWKINYSFLFEKINLKLIKIKSNDPFKEVVLNFLDFYQNGRSLYIDKSNENFVTSEYSVIKDILDSKEIQNNEDQIRAIASDEDNTLLVAGAGTGKTTTIIGKLAYLVERVNVLPEDILLLSFTGQAVKELTTRIDQKFKDSPIKVQTFHSFGLSIIAKATGKKPSLAFSGSVEKKVFLNKSFENLLEEEDYLSVAIEYFAYYLEPVRIKEGFESLDEYYKSVKNEQNITMQGEYVKSYQELLIANFLFLNGVSYRYEEEYVYETADESYSQYKPDFFLTEYNVYLEHFGVDRNNETKFTTDEEQNKISTAKYIRSMEWKRELHSIHNTNLIETYSYEFSEKTWRSNLLDKLIKNRVKIDPKNPREIFNSLAKDVYIKRMTSLFDSFLDLLKSNDYSLEFIDAKINSRDNRRERAFFDLFKPVYESYELYLKENRVTDFHDMLINAKKYLESGLVSPKFKYIIIDEFQDFSFSKYNLIKALSSKCPQVKLFCVGDDWQSIFRFTGSDISLMTKFEELYGFTKKNELVVTNRFNNSLADISNEFILKNPYQIRKEVKAIKNVDYNAVEVLSKNRNDSMDNFLRKILNEINENSFAYNKKSSVFILGRYNYNIPESFAQYKQDYQNLVLDYLTIHSSKGTEADYVIIMGVISDNNYGFPTSITDDPLLELVLSEDSSYPHAEERRLMYVAMTRARRKVYIMTEDGRKSVFALELEKHTDIKNDQVVKCEDCGGDMVLRKGKWGSFYGCSNFPECKATKKI